MTVAMELLQKYRFHYYFDDNDIAFLEKISTSSYSCGNRYEFIFKDNSKLIYRAGKSKNKRVEILVEERLC